MSDLKNYLHKSKEEIDNYLASICSQEIVPEELKQAMEYSVIGAGKRVRAILAITISRALDGSDSNVFPAAAAVEMIHCYSLVHDDLPAMDDDDYRRGKLSTHKKFGEALGILAGDALLTHAFWLIAAKTPVPTLVAPLVKVLAWSAGIGGMVAGQVADILGEDQKPTAELVDFIHTRKTAALITAACQIGAIAAQTTPEQLNAVEEYGQCIGLAFQIADDILDIKSTRETMGKTTGKDAAQNKVTYPCVWGLEKAERRAQQLIDQALRAIANIPNNTHLLDLADFIVSRNK